MRYAALLPCLLLLAGCASPLQRLKDLNPPANDYASSLASEYLAYGESEQEQGRGAFAQHYAEKGLEALKGQNVEPDVLDTSLPGRTQRTLGAARARLLALHNKNMERVAPQKLARAQLLFDCWQHQQTLKIHHELAPCADEFQSTLAELQDIEDNLHFARETSHTVTFAYGSATLDAEARDTVSKIAWQVKAHPQYTIEISAFVGRHANQRRLSQARLKALRHALIQVDIPAGRIHVVRSGGAKAVLLSRGPGTLTSRNITVTVKTADPKKES